MPAGAALGDGVVGGVRCPRCDAAGLGVEDGCDVGVEDAIALTRRRHRGVWSQLLVEDAIVLV